MVTIANIHCGYQIPSNKRLALNKRLPLMRTALFHFLIKLNAAL